MKDAYSQITVYERCLCIMNNRLTVKGSVQISHVCYTDTGLLHGQLRYRELCYHLERPHNEQESTK